jgi:hypothetical protein
MFQQYPIIRIWVPTEPICILVDCPSPMFNMKIILLKNENPSYQLPSEPIGLHKPLQWSVIIHRGELVTKLITQNVARTQTTTKHSPSY